MVAILWHHNFEILNKMHKNQILLKLGEVNFGSIHLKVLGIKVKTKSDQMVKKCYHHYIKTYCKICKHVFFPNFGKKLRKKTTNHKLNLKFWRKKKRKKIMEKKQTNHKLNFNCGKKHYRNNKTNHKLNLNTFEMI